MDGVYCVTRHALVDALRAQLPDPAVEHGRCCTSGCSIRRRRHIRATPSGACAR
jgi:hypothetical protein